MQFSVLCPVHGQVEVGITDIASVVVREDDMVDVVFGCPECGAHIHVSAQVPRVLLASLEEAMVLDSTTGERRLRIVAAVQAASSESGETEVVDPAERHRIDSYCEYFRRQLDSVATVEALLAEIDSR